MSLRVEVGKRHNNRLIKYMYETGTSRGGELKQAKGSREMKAAIDTQKGTAGQLILQSAMIFINQYYCLI